MASPPMFDHFRLDTWKVDMIRHLVYQAITIETLPNSSKHKKANALALRTLQASLNEHLFPIFAKYDSAFAVWSILTSPELLVIINKLRRSKREASEEPCFMAHGNDSFEVTSDSPINDSSSSCLLYTSPSPRDS